MRLEVHVQPFNPPFPDFFDNQEYGAADAALAQTRMDRRVEKPVHAASPGDVHEADQPCLVRADVDETAPENGSKVLRLVTALRRHEQIVDLAGVHRRADAADHVRIVPHAKISPRGRKSRL